MTKLNPDAHVPGIPYLSDIGNKPLVAPLFDGGAKVAAPITVDTAGRPPGASRRHRDYIPSAAKRRAILKERGAVLEEKQPEESVHTRHVVRHKGYDYLSPEESAERRKSQSSEIQRLAKEIWEAEGVSRKRYKEAKKIVSEATEDDVKSPGPRLQKAMELLDGDKPITKAQAIRQARARIYKE